MTNFSETISVLEKKALSEPGDTPARRAYFNLIEMTRSCAQCIDAERMRQLKANIEREVGRLCGRECWEKS
jgi:hypothetical protein